MFRHDLVGWFQGGLVTVFGAAVGGSIMALSFQ